MRVNFRILLLSAAFLGMSAGSAPVMGCARCLALCNSELGVTLQATPALNTMSAELQATVGTESVAAHIDYLTSMCTVMTGFDVTCSVLNGDVYLAVPLNNDRDTTRLYLTLTSAEGVVIAHYQNYVETPDTPVCDATCHQGEVTIVTGPPGG